MSCDPKTINFSNDSSIPVAFFLSLMPLPCLAAWAHATEIELVTIFLVSLMLNYGVVVHSKYAYAQNDPVARSIIRARSMDSLKQQLHLIPVVQLATTLERFAFLRTMSIFKSFILFQVPLILFIAGTMVQRLPSRLTGYLFLTLHEAVYALFFLILVLFQQMDLTSQLRETLSREMKIPVGTLSVSPASLLHDIRFLKFLFVGVSFLTSFGFLVFCLEYKAVDVTQVFQEKLLAAVFLFGMITIVLVWRQQGQIFRRFIGKLKAREMESSEVLSENLDFHRMMMLGQSLALMAHDFALPVSVIKLEVERITASRDESTDWESVEAIRKSNLQLERLIANIRGRIRGELVGPFGTNLGECFDAVVSEIDLHSRLFLLKTSRIEISPDARSVMVAMQKVEIIQVFSNVIQNAISSTAGVVSIKLESVSLRSVIISISDNGVGLSKSRFEELTSVSRRGHDANDVVDGLGLKLVCRMLERVGGSVMVDERSGSGGTLILIELPKVAAVT